MGILAYSGKLAVVSIKENFALIFTGYVILFFLVYRFAFIPSEWQMYTSVFQFLLIMAILTFLSSLLAIIPSIGILRIVASSFLQNIYFLLSQSFMLLGLVHILYLKKLDGMQWMKAAAFSLIVALLSSIVSIFYPQVTLIKSFILGLIVALISGVFIYFAYAKLIGLCKNTFSPFKFFVAFGLFLFVLNLLSSLLIASTFNLTTLGNLVTSNLERLVYYVLWGIILVFSGLRE